MERDRREGVDKLKRMSGKKEEEICRWIDGENEIKMETIDK